MFFGFAMTLLLVLLLTRAFAASHMAELPYTPYKVPAQPQALARGLAPLDILRERYARGEIDTETFEMMAEHLLRYEREGR